MALTPTAQRMLRTLPAYHWGNPFTERLLQGLADEIDRLDAFIDACILGVIPGASDDTYGFLSLWEQMLRLPVNPAGVTIEARQANISAKFLALDAVSSKDVLALLQLTVGDVVQVLRNTPTQLKDTYTIPAAADSYEGGRGAAMARAVQPSHRQAVIVFAP